MPTDETNGLANDRDVRLDELRTKLAASERTGLSTRAAALRAEIERVTDER